MPSGAESDPAATGGAGSDGGPAEPTTPHGRIEGAGAQDLRVALRNDHLVIPALGVDADVRAGDIEAGELTVPSDVSAVTLWSGSADLSAPTGSVLVAGHVDNRSQGPGALHDLYLARAGDVVYLTHDSVVTRWKILGLQVVPKNQIPATLFAGPDGQRVLNLVTCGGTVTDGHYDKNVIATAAQF
ncbi:MAG: class F sortase [Nakamurella sp.]